jgi:diguanylate cyclase (GGDEF)-like protein/PAS domain S-box-containing protein
MRRFPHSERPELTASTGSSAAWLSAPPTLGVGSTDVVRRLLRLALGFGRMTWPFDLGLGAMVVAIHWQEKRVAGALIWWLFLAAVLLGRWRFCQRPISGDPVLLERSQLGYVLFGAAEGTLWALVLVAAPLASPYATLAKLAISMIVVFGATLPYAAAGRPWIACVAPLGAAQLLYLLTRDLPLRAPLIIGWALGLAGAAFTAYRLRRALVANVVMRRRAEMVAREREVVAAELTRSREQLRLALDAIDAGIADTNLITGERFFSNRYAELLGYASREEFARVYRFSSALHAGDRERVLEARRAHIESGTPFREELRMQRRDGTYVWVQMRGESVRGSDGRATRFVASMVDVSARREADQRIADSERRYRALVEASPSLIWTCDVAGRITFVSDRACRQMYGFEPGEVIGRSLLDFTVPDSAAARRAILRCGAQLAHGRPLFDVELVQQTRHRTALVVLVSALPILSPDGMLHSVFGVCSDVTVLKRRERELSVALRNQQALFDAAGEGIVFLRGGVVESVNRALLQMLALPRESVLGRPIAEVFSATADWAAFERDASAAAARNDGAHQEVLIRTEDGRSAWCQFAGRSVGDGAMILVVTDVTALKRREELAWHHANHDELTGLPNRRSLIDHARWLLSLAGRHGRRAAIMVIDLDGFKAFNDLLGHAQGDALLRRVASRMLSVMREYDVVARTGGDEFVVLLPDIEGPEAASIVAGKLIAAVAEDVEQGAHTLSVRASIGIAIAPADGHDLDTLLAGADQAMYAAKARGRNCYVAASTLRGPAPPTSGGALAA